MLAFSALQPCRDSLARHLLWLTLTLLMWFKGRCCTTFRTRPEIFLDSQLSIRDHITPVPKYFDVAKLQRPTNSRTFQDQEVPLYCARTIPRRCHATALSRRKRLRPTSCHNFSTSLPSTYAAATRFFSATPSRHNEADSGSSTDAQPLSNTIWPPWQLSDLGKEVKLYEKYGPNYIDHVDEKEQLKINRQ